MVLEPLLRPSPEEREPPLRGVWLTGAVAAPAAPPAGPRADVGFVADLFEQRLFRERNLTVPTAPWYRSRRRPLRLLRLAAVGAAGALAVALALSVRQLATEAATAAAARAALRLPPAAGADGCADPQGIYGWFGNAARLDPPLRAPAIPASWLLPHPAGDAGGAVAAALATSILPALACRLRQRVERLPAAIVPPPGEAGQGGALRRALLAYAAEVTELSERLRQFRALATAAPAAADGTATARLAAVTAYAYGAPLPAEPGADGPLRRALRQVTYPAGDLPLLDPQRLVEPLAVGARDARAELDRELTPVAARRLG